MTTAARGSVGAGVHLSSDFARRLPGLSVPWQAEDAPDPRLLELNEPLARELGLDPAWLRGDAGVGLLVGTDLPPDASPVAQGYAGHQFGSFVPRLGDGRALLLGELTDVHGRRRDLHLKGSGRTPFARGGDGLAAVGPMLREYLVSEAMHALGVPTTRALAVVATGRPVRRETLLPGAVLARVASSHLRVGSFQYAAATGDRDLLRDLADHAITIHHPEAAAADRPHLALFEAVRDAQASLVAQWMLLGFVHGVMNTDNTTISGETIDYGPCAFLDAFDPTTVFSSIDAGGRYAYRNQPLIAQWNLARLAESLLPLIDEDQDEAFAVAEHALNDFPQRYQQAWSSGMAAKIGLSDADTDTTGGDRVDGLIEQLLALLTQHRVDYTSFFRALADAGRGDAQRVRAMVPDGTGLDGWLQRWLSLGPDPAAMDRSNPLYIPRNHLVEESLTAATAGDLAPFQKLLEAVTAPFEERADSTRYTQPGPPGPYLTFCGT